MKYLIAVLAVASLSVVLADEAKEVKYIDPSTMEPAKFKRMMYRATGGTVVKPGSMQGRMVFVNCQTNAPASWLEQNAETFKGFTHLDIGVEQGSFSFPTPKIVGNASLFVIDDEKMPTILSAPENRWAMVNVAPLRKGAGAKVEFFAARVQKELTRAFVILAGAQDSNYPNALVGCITSPEQLDTFVDCRLPQDVMRRIHPYVKGYGVAPAVSAKYIKACQEGWAPAPTNDVQKKIWDKTHTVPAKPIKVEFDPKKGE